MGLFNKELAEHAEKLKKIAIFESIKDNEDAVKQVLDICSIRKFGKNDCLIKEGDMGDELFILLEGSVDILKKTMAGDDYVVASLKAEYNIFIGEMALIDDDKRSATVMATEDTTALVIGKKDFLELGDSDPHIGLPVTRAIAKIIGGRLRKTNEDMMTLFDALVTEVQD
ncbi:MAG: cyclic nucleotide-binding domain-containing protein [Spirochaetales bacterium]|uniref:Cyclic nucleotide-binding domain-containing protein n=1 Tax=Candidatus Thalassospirochaeta sargassi TaxID=3119039 RepID=A0AAJ1IDQ4_9SPIO|nr:cyclic nucleotide-binding domain-containing protein [Spirochaetales bacterium]